MVSTKTLSAQCPQTDVADSTVPCPPFCLVAVIFGVDVDAVNNTECLLLVGTLSFFESGDQLLADLCHQVEVAEFYA